MCDWLAAGGVLANFSNECMVEDVKGGLRMAAEVEFLTGAKVVIY